MRVHLSSGLLILSLCTAWSQKIERIKIAAIFNSDEDEKHSMAFQYAVEMTNGLLSKHRLNNRKLESEILKIPSGDNYRVQKATCHLLEKGVMAIFGPQDDSNADHIRSITDSMEIPFIDTRWNYNPTDIEGEITNDYTVNIHPDISVLGLSFVELINSYGWDTVTVLYEDNQSIVRLKRIFDQTSEVLLPNTFTMVIKKLLNSEEDGYRNVLREVFKSKSRNILLECRRELIDEILKQAQQIGMMSEEYNYIIMNLDAHTINYEDYKHGGTNFTAFRLIDTNKKDIQNIVYNIVSHEMNKGKAVGVNEGKELLDTNTALIYDAVSIFALALGDLMITQDVRSSKLYCDGDVFGNYGNSLVNYMKMNEFYGMSGWTKFDSNGIRSIFQLDVIELQSQGMTSIGCWDPVDGLNITRQEEFMSLADNGNIMANKTFVVTLIETHPYTMLKEESKKLEGNDRFEGFAIDLIYEISKKLHFNVTLKLVDDGKYGNLDEHGNWDGMINEVLLGSESGGADFAVADLSITTSRASAVKFSIPFMNLGISIIYIKPRPAPPSMISFLSPFTLEVWIFTGIAFVVVSLVLYVLARFSPYEWVNPISCIQNPVELENQFNISNSFWFTIGTLLQQGSDVAPIATSTRLLAGMWFFFALIITASYTANLAAFLTVETLDRPIDSAEQLASQTKIKYGVVRDGSTMNFFKDSGFETYSKMWEFMSAHREEVMVSSNEEGINKVIESDGGYAFMMESASIEYMVERVCTLTQIGGLLDNKGYGIASAPSTPYKNLLDSAILQLQEAGVFFKLKTKWWKQKRGGGACESDSGGGAVDELGLANVAGVFLVTFAGCVFALFFAILEMCYGAKRQSEDMGTSWWTEIKEELRFAFKCHGTLKAVRKPHSDVGCSQHSSRIHTSYDLGKRSTVCLNPFEEDS